MITTIQIHETVKKALDKLKTNKQSYEEVILVLMEKTEIEKRKNKELLKEGCLEMAGENLKITKEFEAIDDLWDW
ncbi:hypothetical protein J4449_04125 [Candidatus Woesearchaeota archaeon]|nr:hypothetical protein [Candidatus Woesearchaeota archaeon]